MKKAAILCLALFAVVVNANDIQFWFSTEANVQTAATTGPLNPNIAGVPGASTRLYLYANTPGHWVSMYDQNEYVYFTGWATDNTWEGVALDLLFQGPASLGADNKVLNNATPFGLTRWNDTSDFTWTPINAVATAERGLGGANNANNGGSGGVFDSKQYCNVPQHVGDSGILTSMVGWVQVTLANPLPAASDLFLVVGTQGIARRQGAVLDDHVYFGAGDAYLLGNAFGAHSDVSDAHFTPEPASLVLLALAGLALRRR
jgi:MYXO-CTERM domain-containing protein